VTIARVYGVRILSTIVIDTYYYLIVRSLVVFAGGLSLATTYLNKF